MAAKTGVQPRQPLDPQQQQVTGARFFQVAHTHVQLHLEITAVGEPGQAVLVRLGTQPLAALGLLGEQCLELLDHLVHRLHYPTQLRCARQLGQAEEFAAGNGVGLLDHVVQRPQLATQEQGAEYRTGRATQQQPTQAAQGALPELGNGEHRVADHLNARSLLPATADDGVAAGSFQADQAHEPARYTAGVRLVMALYQHSIGA